MAEAWLPLEIAAAGTDAALAATIVRTPADRLDAAGHTRLAALLAAVANTHAGIMRTRVLQRCAREPRLTDDRGLRRVIAQSLRASAPPERTAAANAAVVRALAEPGRATSRLHALCESVRDDRRAILAVLDAMHQHLRSRSQSQRAALARAVYRALQHDEVLAAPRLSVVTAHLPALPLVRLLEREAADLARPDVLSAVLDGIARRGERPRWQVVPTQYPDASRSRSRARPRTWPDAPSGWHARVEKSLARHANDFLRRVALAALLHAPEPWDARRLARLATFRADDSPLVAAVAQLVLPIEELEIPAIHE